MEKSTSESAGSFRKTDGNQNSIRGFSNHDPSEKLEEIESMVSFTKVDAERFADQTFNKIVS
tara:strand:+ start:340 stop:525 length:186 start_codon:yes stop_codon:yes gene_type:complete